MMLVKEGVKFIAFEQFQGLDAAVDRR